MPLRDRTDHRIAQHYAQDSAWTLETAPDYFAKRRGGQAGASSLSGADATMWTFEPHVATAIYDAMLREVADKVTVVPNNYFTLARNFGKQIQHWNGLDATVNLRFGRQFTLQGGLSTGRQVTDNCEVVADLPEAALLTAPYCRQVQDFLTDAKLVGSYSAVVGLPLYETVALLEGAGYPVFMTWMTGAPSEV